MFAYFKKLALTALVFLVLIFVLFIINQTSQVVALASGVHPHLGQVVLYGLLVVYAAAIVIPLAAIMKRPTALFPPADTESDEYKIYIQKLSGRLRRNPYLEKTTVEDDNLATIEEAVRELNEKADERIREAASHVFIMTAISQYGALDALIVTLAQFRMIWRVTILYNQRPSLRELAYLYGNVFATAFLATRLENLDLLEDQLEPVIASAMGSSLSSFTPALNTAANIITSSIIQGSANAYLTLRVGLIARNYCASLVRRERSQIRRSAAVQAAAMLSRVLGDSTYKVTRAVVRATAKAGKRPFRYGHGLVTRSSKKTFDAGKTTLQKSGELAKQFGGALRDSGKRIKLFFVGPEPGEGE